MAFDSLFGILVVPAPNYLLGLMGFAALYGIVGIGVAIDEGAIERVAATVSRRR